MQRDCPDPHDDRRGSDCGCDRASCSTSTPSIARRDFLAVVSAATAGACVPRWPVMAGPFEEINQYRAAIPADKKLDRAWVASLHRRGEKETYTDPASLRHIGMPVGGLFAGTVYLGGDGRLWLWNIFNGDQEGILPRPLKNTLPNGGRSTPLVANMVRGGLNYLEPAEPVSPFEQGFSLTVGKKKRPLDLRGFSRVSFDGRYPIGRVSYRDDGCPLDVELEAFSPFIPLDVDSSSLPVTILRYTLTNRSERRVQATLSGHLENPICLETRDRVTGRLQNRVRREGRLTSIDCTATPPPKESTPRPRPDILFEDFEKDTYDGWTVEGDAFGRGPVRTGDIPGYQGDVGGHGQRVVNSHASAPGDDVGSKDARIGKLTSAEFELTRHYVQFRVGGGAHRGETCVNLVVRGEVVASRTGRNNNRMHRAALDVRRYEGQKARLEVIDQGRGGWGNIGVDEIIFTDRALEDDAIERQRDYGSMSLSVLDGDQETVAATADRAEGATADRAEGALGRELTGEIRRTVRLDPGQETTVTWVIAWHFPNLRVRAMPGVDVGNSYAARFGSAAEAARFVADNIDRLAGATRKWVETWYDSTLPYWLLDRTMANTSTLATTTCYRFRDGRFWAWEGIGCCAGTCTHVWHYAQAVARLFPEIERDQRERVDFGLGFHDDGGVGHRAYLDRSAHPAIDGQCGRILGVYREHLMSKDGGFLRTLWPRVKKAIEWLIARDGNSDGILEGAQHNTLDAAWYGRISWLISLYLATLRAGEAMANELGDRAFAERCRQTADRGARNILETWNGEYFVQIEDPDHADAIGTGPGCHIDQVFGQTWAHWVGLGTLFDREKQLSALRALWKYNFAPDVGLFREKFQRGRWYAARGDAGLVMCTWPRGGENPGYSKHWQYGYFNECMTGFEWQAAAHMIWEGHDQPDLLESGLGVSRAIHDRYSGALRNPYNEVECSDHYARAMASYGVFQAVCGFACHGPRRHLAFAPRLSPENFRAAFTAPTAWGTYEQRLGQDDFRVRLAVRWGRLPLDTLGIVLPKSGLRARSVDTTGISLSGFEQKGDEVLLHFETDSEVTEGAVLEARVRVG